MSKATVPFNYEKFLAYLRSKGVRIVSLLLILTVAGCAGDQKGQQTITVSTPPPIPQFDPNAARKEDVAKLSGAVDQVRTDIATSSNATQAQMTGAVNLSLGKIAERFTGVEANIDSLAKIQAQMNNTVNARVDANLTAISEIKADIKNEIALSAKLDSVINATITMTNKIGDINANLDTKLEALAAANANGQIGLKNDLTSTLNTIKNDNTAGHDVNYLPKEVVAIMESSMKQQIATIESNNKTWLAIVTGLFSAVTGVATIMAYSARKRETGTQQLLQLAMTHVPPDKAREFMPRPPNA